jgi:hypothetical protein
MEEEIEKQENKNVASESTNVVRQIMSGRIFVITGIQKHLGYIFFVFFLAVVYIGYCYSVENTATENKKLDEELKLLRTEYVYKSTNLMMMGKKSEVLKQIEKRNLTLKEPRNPFTRVK